MGGPGLPGYRCVLEIKGCHCFLDILSTTDSRLTGDTRDIALTLVSQVFVVPMDFLDSQVAGVTPDTCDADVSDVAVDILDSLVSKDSHISLGIAAYGTALSIFHWYDLLISSSLIHHR